MIFNLDNIRLDNSLLYTPVSEEAIINKPVVPIKQDIIIIPR